jgi:hypothetical protein
MITMPPTTVPNSAKLTRKPAEKAENGNTVEVGNNIGNQPDVMTTAL